MSRNISVAEDLLAAEARILVTPFHSSSQRRFGLDVVRAAAIMLVIVGHASTSMTHSVGSLAFYLGYWGVEVFFVLSGYLIGGILLKIIDDKPSHLRGALFGFYARRWLRTLPNYFLLLFIASLLWMKEVGSAPPSWPSYLVFLQNPLHIPPGFFVQSWSLAVEEWFYLLFALLLMISSRSIGKAQGLVGTVAVFLLIPIALRFFLSRSGMSWTELRMATFCRLDAIAYGVIGAAIARYRPRLWKNAIRFWWPSALFLLVSQLWFFWGGLDQKATLFAVLVFPCTSVGVLFLLPALEALPSWKGWLGSTVTFLSLTSYSAYLIHTTVQMEFAKLFNYFLPHLPILKAFAWIGVVFGLSWSLYRWFELPIMKLRDRLWA